MAGVCDQNMCARQIRWNEYFVYTLYTIIFSVYTDYCTYICWIVQAPRRANTHTQYLPRNKFILAFPYPQPIVIGLLLLVSCSKIWFDYSKNEVPESSTLLKSISIKHIYIYSAMSLVLCSHKARSTITVVTSINCKWSAQKNISEGSQW